MVDWAAIRSDWQVLKWILLEADMWVEPPLVEQIFIIDSQRCEKHLVPSDNLVLDNDNENFSGRQEQEWAVESVPTLVNLPSPQC